MNSNLFSNTYGKIVLSPGWPVDTRLQPLPNATIASSIQDFGKILFQEIKTTHYTFRYFVFSFLEDIVLQQNENDEGLQSLLCIKGNTFHHIKGVGEFYIAEGQFQLLNALNSQIETKIPGGKECHLINAYYGEGFYKDLVDLFPVLSENVQRKIKKPFMLFRSSKPVLYDVLDATHSLLLNTYRKELQSYYWSLKMKESLFGLLEQANKAGEPIAVSKIEREKAEEVRNIIATDISKHHSNDQLASMVHWSEASLKRAFKKEFGMGMYEYLRMLRMQKAKELLLQGAQVKSVALTIGMRPSNFTSEFRKYFGYNATTIRK
jgi:AraC-like DNA-binding protein